MIYTSGTSGLYSLVTCNAQPSIVPGIKTGSKIYKCKEKFVILQSIGIIAIKSSETRAVIYTCRYCSGHF